MRRLRVIALLFVAVSAIVIAALAGIETAVPQDYPSRPITMVVPFPAGGAGTRLPAL